MCERQMIFLTYFSVTPKTYKTPNNQSISEILRKNNISAQEIGVRLLRVVA